MKTQQVGNNGRGSPSQDADVTRTVKKEVVKMSKAVANVLRQHHDDENDKGADGDGPQRNARGAGRLSTVKGLENINAAAVWAESMRTTLYRVNGEFWMSDELSLGEPERKVVHTVSQVSEQVARTFLGDRSNIEGIDEAESRIITLDQKDGVVR